MIRSAFCPRRRWSSEQNRRRPRGSGPWHQAHSRPLTVACATVGSVERPAGALMSRAALAGGGPLPLSGGIAGGGDRADELAVNLVEVDQDHLRPAAPG